jgi:hypothetical protein
MNAHLTKNIYTCESKPRFGIINDMVLFMIYALSFAAAFSSFFR